MANLRAVQYLWEVKMFENAQPKIFWQPNIAVVFNDLQWQCVSSLCPLVIHDTQENIASSVLRTMYIEGTIWQNLQ